jgi:hypothetical protein
VAEFSCAVLEIKTMRIKSIPLCSFKTLRERDQVSASDSSRLKRRLLRLFDHARCVQDCVVCIACRELEDLCLADLEAVAVAFELRELERRQNISKYRVPDLLGNPKQELKQLTGNRYQPLAGSQAIGEHLDVNNNRPASLRALIQGIRGLEAEPLWT